MDQSVTQTKIDGFLGAGLMTAPLWHLVLSEISLVASCIAAVCGALLGISSVWRLIKDRP